MSDDPWASFRVAPAAGNSASVDPWAAFRAAPAGTDQFDVPSPIPSQDGATSPVPMDPIPTARRSLTERMMTPSQWKPDAPPYTGLASRELPPGVPTAAGADVQLAAGLAKDPEQRKRIYAAQVFPNMPTAQALSRMFLSNGRLAAMGDDNKPVYLEPETPAGMTTGPMRTWTGMAPSNLAQNVAGAVGAIPPLAGAVAGGMMAAPTSMVAGPAAAAAGASLGDMVRQYLARQFDPASTRSLLDPRPDSWRQTAEEAAMGAGGQFLGAGFNRMGGASNPMNMRTQDIRRVQAPGVLDEARANIADARAQGVDLSMGQATGNPGMIGIEDVAYRTPTVPGGQDVAGQFYAAQRGQVGQAGRGMLDTIAPQISKTEAALQFRDHSGEASHAIRQQGNALARGAYDAAEAAPMPAPWSVPLPEVTGTPGVNAAGNPSLRVSGPGPGLAHTLNSSPADFKLYDMLKTPDASAAYGAAVNSAANDGITIPTLKEVLSGATVPFQGWDHMKKVLQGQSTQAAREGNYHHATQLTDMANAIKNEVSAINPAYGDALRITAPYQRMAQELKDSAVGRAGEMDSSARVQSIVAPVFRQANPEFVAAARQAFVDTNGENAWNNGIRSYVHDTIDNASKGAMGLNPASLHRTLIGDTDNRAVLQAAMTPDQFSGFEKFMGVVGNMAKTPAMGSPTNPREVTASVLMGQAETPLAKLFRHAGDLFSLEGVNTLRKIGHAVSDNLTQRNASKIVDMLFDRDGMRFLEAMAKVPIGQQQSTNVQSQMLARALLNGQGSPSPGAGQPPSQSGFLPSR